MNDEKQNNPVPKTGLIDRRFFLKASSATAAVIAAGGVIPTLVAENQNPVAPIDGGNPAATRDNNDTNKQWKAGWMAF